ncbi:MAG: hypothetical protein EPO20_19285 [Betaproteobacteria bacterium]|nr:MAG: hypothetical protein EPO20_19285 [Betaproteobacteria bacterium]
MLLPACALLLLRWIVWFSFPVRSCCRRLAGHFPLRAPRLAKPAWVRREVIRLKALMREDGTCRAIADTSSTGASPQRGT